MVLKGENHHSSEQAKPFELRCQSEARALKVFSGPDQGSVAVASVTFAGSETNPRGNAFGKLILTGPKCFEHLGQLFIYLFIYSYQPYLLSHRQKVSSLKPFVRMGVCKAPPPPPTQPGDPVNPVSWGAQ